MKRSIHLAVAAMSIHLAACAASRGAALPRFETVEEQRFAERFAADHERYQADPDGFFRPEARVECAPTPELVEQETSAAQMNEAGAPHAVEYSRHDAVVEILQAACEDGVARNGDVLYRVSYRETITMRRHRRRSSKQVDFVVDAVLRDGKRWRERARFHRMGGLESELRLKSGKKVTELDPEQVRNLAKVSTVLFSYSDVDTDPSEPGYVSATFTPPTQIMPGLRTTIVRTLPDGGLRITRWTRDKKTSIARMDREGRFHGEQVDYELAAGNACFRHGEQIKTLDCNVD